MTLPIAEYSVRRERDVTQVAHRGRLLATMFGLESKQCINFRKAIATVTKRAADAGGGSVQFGVETIGDSPFAQATVSWNAKDHHAGSLDSTDSHTAEVASLVDCVESDSNQDGQVVIHLRIAVPLEFATLTENDVADWAAALKAHSTQGALADSQKRLRRLANELSANQRKRGQLEDELRQTRSINETLTLLSLVASKTDNAVIILEENGAVSWVNDAFVRMTGYVLPEVSRRQIVDVLVGDQTGMESIRGLRAAFANGHGTTEEFLHYRKAGNTAWLSLNLTPIHADDGSLSRWIGIGSDVTRSREAQQALESAKNAAEIANKTKSEFLANMSHEIRTPMNAILGMTELTLCTDLSAEQREYLMTVKDSGDLLLHLLNDILDLSKIEAGRLEIDTVPFNLADLIRDTLKTLSIRAHDKGLELVWRVPPDIPQELIGDPLRIRQVLINLVGNAIKFTYHGEITVDVERQWDTESEVGLHFRVADTGIGIAADKLDKIFEAFTQADGSTARQFGGTGLGLTISSELIRMMNGKIWVHSEKDRGSQFHFSLRLQVSDEPSVPMNPLDLEMVSGKRVLVVDDNTTNRRIIRERLKSWEMQTVEADSADTALAELSMGMATHRPFDLVILDAAMPEKDGFQLMMEINAQPSIQCGTVMMLSSADRHADAEACRELGIKACLTKPISPSTMLDAIRTALGDEEISPTVEGSRPSVPDARMKLRVLVADDHPANRRLAARILEKRGHEATPAINGREVLDLVDENQFDLVLMDVQMPEMDGFQATAAIRERERETGTHLPLIALTAHAMKGDRERCLAAGMDAYLSKPLQASELIALVETIGTSNVPGLLSDRASAASQEFDFGPALARMDDDDELLREQMQFFLTDGPELILRVFESIEHRDGEQLRLAAHRLKGLFKSYDADKAADLAMKLEFMGQDTDFGNAVASAKQLAELNETLLAAMRSYLSTQLNSATQ